MRGDRRSATESFNNAILLDPKISVFREEVLDANVITFFNYTKKATLKKYRKQKMKQQKNKKKLSKKKKKNKRGDPTKEKQVQQASAPKDSEGGGFGFSHLMPFGVGHFVDGNVFWGVLYGAGQATTLAIYFKKLGDIDAERAENEETLDRTDISSTEKDNFIEENNDFISF